MKFKNNYKSKKRQLSKFISATLFLCFVFINIFEFYHSHNTLINVKSNFHEISNNKEINNTANSYDCLLCHWFSSHSSIFLFNVHSIPLNKIKVFKISSKVFLTILEKFSTKSVRAPPAL